PNSSNPFRIDRLQSFTCDQDHDYTAEQRARNGGLMDQFPRFDALGPTDPRQFCHKGSDGQFDTVMGYFDGNTVTAPCNHPQPSPPPATDSPPWFGPPHRGPFHPPAGCSFGLLWGPSDPVFGDLPEGGPPVSPPSPPAPTNGKLGTFVDDTDPYWDVCSQGS